MNTESDTDTGDKEGRGREEEEGKEKEGGTGGWETLEGGRPCQGRGVEPTEKGRVKGGGGGGTGASGRERTLKTFQMEPS